MSRIKAKKIVKNYAEKLKMSNFPFQSVYLYGSYAKNKAHKWSDIDIAVVSNKLRRNFDKNESLLWRFREDVDTRIEPIGFTVKDFQDINNPMVWEIRNTGIKIV